jgi:UV DNA damage repair endonuclease
LTVENDDKTYTPADLLPVCKAKESQTDHPLGRTAHNLNQICRATRLLLSVLAA